MIYIYNINIVKDIQWAETFLLTAYENWLNLVDIRGFDSEAYGSEC
jgi:hypothetical protein